MAKKKSACINAEMAHEIEAAKPMETQYISTAEAFKAFRHLEKMIKELPPIHRVPFQVDTRKDMEIIEDFMRQYIKMDPLD
jgi:hypothetical protein